MDDIFKAAPYSGATHMTFLAIGDNADDETGLAYPGLAYLEWKTRLSRRSVQMAIQQLEADGWMRVSYGAGDSGTNIYAIDTDRLHKEAERRYEEFKIGRRERHNARIARLMAKGTARPDGKSGGKACANPVEELMDNLFEGVQSTTEGVQPLHLGGAIYDTGGCNLQHEGVQPLHPNHHITTIEPLTGTTTNHQAPPPTPASGGEDSLSKRPALSAEHRWSEFWTALKSELCSTPAFLEKRFPPLYPPEDDYESCFRDSWAGKIIDDRGILHAQLYSLNPVRTSAGIAKHQKRIDRIAKSIFAVECVYFDLLDGSPPP